MQGKITKSAVDVLKPGQTLADSEVKGFVARRLPSGVISYGLRYRAGGNQRWLALGLHGRITPDAARRLAKKAAGEVADCRDPNSERQAERAKENTTLDVVLDFFVDRHVRKNSAALARSNGFSKSTYGAHRQHANLRASPPRLRGDAGRHRRCEWASDG